MSTKLIGQLLLTVRCPISTLNNAVYPTVRLDLLAKDSNAVICYDSGVKSVLALPRGGRSMSAKKIMRS